MTVKKSKPAADLRAKLAEAQTKAKAVTGKAKVASVMATEVIKANTQVVVDSGKILSGGIKEIGAVCVANGRKAIVALADDANALSKVKSMPDFIRLQAEQSARAAPRASFTRQVEDVAVERDALALRLAQPANRYPHQWWDVAIAGREPRLWLGLGLALVPPVYSFSRLIFGP